MQQFSVTTPGTSKDDALFIQSMLDEAAFPVAHAVSSHCIDEAADTWQITAYYDDRPTAQDFAPLLLDTAISPADLVIEPVADTNWVEKSLKGLSPVVAGRFCIYGEHDRDNKPNTSISLEINAGTAFGTGHHETTTGCLLALDHIAKSTRPANILDVGCGTGVLAIAAAKLLKSPVIASDIDPEAVRVTRSNAIGNNVGPLVRTVTAPGTDAQMIVQNAPYDLIFANILAGPLVTLAPDISALVAYNGNVVLSGLNISQEQWVLAAWRAFGLVPAKRYHLGNWSSLILHRPNY